MFRTIISGGLHGMDSYLVHVEVDASQGLPVFEIVGYQSGEVREARERIRVALKNSGYKLPPIRITVNLTPANIRKEGTAYDLPIAVGILAALEFLPKTCADNTLVLGELGLDGQVRAVRGVLPLVMEAKRNGCAVCMVPFDNYAEASCVDGIHIMGIKTLAAAIDFLKKSEGAKKECIHLQRKALAEIDNNPKGKSVSEGYDFSVLSGQENIKRSAVIAAAGFHHLLFKGPPGCGKTLAAKCIPSILPPLSREESLEVSKLFSIAGLINSSEGLVSKRPFFNPHHTITKQAMAGGGVIPKPGIISLSHRGVLFLNELPHFKNEVIEIMRQPLEEKEINIVRTSGTYRYPASFLLVAAMNPCPCGFFPDRNRCNCTAWEIKRYLAGISGPIMDRIDLSVNVNAVRYEDISGDNSVKGECSSSMLNKVFMARHRQQERYKGTDIRYNGELSGNGIKKYITLERSVNCLMKELFENSHLSARSYAKVLKVARTIADIEDRDNVAEEDVLEACTYQQYINEQAE